MKKRLITLANAVTVFVALLALWQAIIWVFHVAPYMLPSPLAVHHAAVARISSILHAFSDYRAGSGWWAGR